MKKLRIAYFGTPYFSARFLEKLLSDSLIKRFIEVEFVVTQPDQPVGRKQILTKSPVKLIAEKYGIEVLDLDFKNSSKIEHLKLKIKQIDMAFLYAYGGIIPKEIINASELGFWNTHPSLLPKYRGALPITMPLILDDQETGVTLIRLDEKVDHGPIIAQEKLAISPTDKRPDLEVKLTDLAFEMFKKIVINLPGDQVVGLKTTPQDHSQATFTYQINKDAGFIPVNIIQKALKNEGLSLNELPKIIIDFAQQNNITINQYNDLTIYNLFRGLYPWPGLWTTVNIKGQQKRLKITGLEFLKNRLILTKVQLEGKKEVDFKTFNNAYKILAF